MNLSSDQIQGLYILAVVVGFLGYVVVGPLPAPGAVISRMGYFVRTGALALGSVLAIMLATAFLKTFAVWAPPWAYIATSLAIGLAAGAYAGLVALGRSLDSGGGRGFAALGIVPFGNLFVAFANPNSNPARPPYLPTNAFIRFLIGFFTLVLGSAIANGLGSWMESSEGTSALLEREIASMNASLPRKLDEITTLIAVRHDAARRRIIYEHTLLIEDESVFSSASLKAAIVPGLCSDPGIRALIENGYVLEYKYATESGNVVDGLVLVMSDCL